MSKKEKKKERKEGRKEEERKRKGKGRCAEAPKRAESLSPRLRCLTQWRRTDSSQKKKGGRKVRIF